MYLYNLLYIKIFYLIFYLFIFEKGNSSKCLTSMLLPFRDLNYLDLKPQLLQLDTPEDPSASYHPSIYLQSIIDF